MLPDARRLQAVGPAIVCSARVRTSIVAGLIREASQGQIEQAKCRRVHRPLRKREFLMKDQNIQTHTIANGLTLVTEPMPDVQSAAFSILVPSGSVHDERGRNGTAAILTDLITRGAGSRDTQQLSDALDNLGLQRGESVGCDHITLSGATLAGNLPEAFRISADILRRPHLPPDQFEPARSGVEQALKALEDEPRQKVIIELRRRCYASPWGLPSDGTLAELPEITHASVSRLYNHCFRPNGSIIGVAGRIDAGQIRDLVEELFGSWESKSPPKIEAGALGPKLDQIHHDSNQTHIGIAYDAVPYADSEYYAAWAAVGILSGGMSSRLFTEVREKRGLCYAVYAALSSLTTEGRVLCYAGTSNERAQETLEVTLAELVRLADGFQESELDRCKARAKSSLIMQQESTISRSSSIARDWFYLNRVQTLSEVREKIEALSVDGVLDYVHRHPARDFTILTIGPEPVDPPQSIGPGSA